MRPSLSLELDQTQRLLAAFANGHGACQARHGLDVRQRRSRGAGACMPARDLSRRATRNPLALSIRYGVTLQQHAHLRFKLAQFVRSCRHVEGVDQFLQSRALRGDILFAKHQQGTLQRMRA
jgi:hypothetical protein